MSLACVATRAQLGLEAPAVTVEVHCGNGLPQFSLVGLAEVSVRDSRDRVRAALSHCGYDFPPGRITVNLAPADLQKDGGRFDLPIALGVLAASGQLPAAALAGIEFYGELALSGELRPVPGLLAAAVQAVRQGHRLLVPAANSQEARMAAGLAVASAATLTEVCLSLQGKQPLQFSLGQPPLAQAQAGPDLADVYGQPMARRALEVAAAGGHSLLMLGPPGAGKSMLAERLGGLLPPLDEAEALESAMLHSVGALSIAVDSWRRRPFRAPHHSASAVAIIGGGSRLQPGEISLAHHGVLFLDELPEFRRDVLEALREPLESGSVSVARANYRGCFPARFQLVAAMNPCPCGHAGDRHGRCRCSEPQRRRYLAKLSGPLLDRIDLHVEVPRLDYEALRPAGAVPESSAVVAVRVMAARERQLRRGGSNSGLPTARLVSACQLESRGETLLATASRRLGLSARACHRVLRVARTIADLALQERVDVAAISEALGYRRLDRQAPEVAA